MEWNAGMASAVMTWVWIGILLAQINNAESHQSGKLTISRGGDHKHLRDVRPNDRIEGTFPSPVWNYFEGKGSFADCICIYLKFDQV